MLQVCQVIGETCLVSTPLPLSPDPNTTFTRFTLLAPKPRAFERPACVAPQAAAQSGADKQRQQVPSKYDTAHD